LNYPIYISLHTKKKKKSHFYIYTHKKFTFISISIYEHKKKFPPKLPLFKYKINIIKKLKEQFNYEWMFFLDDDTNNE